MGINKKKKCRICGMRTFNKVKSAEEEFISCCECCENKYKYKANLIKALDKGKY